MDVFDFLNTGGFETRVNPRYNPKSKKNTEPAEITILNLDGESQPGVDMALVDFSNQSILSAEDTKKFEDIGAHWNPYRDVNIQLAEQQSNFSKIANSLGQTLVSEIGIGTIKGFSDLFDLVGQVTGFSDGDYNNPLTKVLEEAQEGFRAWAPIYADPNKNITNGGLFDVGWIASNLPSVASSLTLLIPSTAATKALSYIGKSASGFTKAGLRAMSRTNKAIANGKKLNAFQRAISSSSLGKTTSLFLENGTTAVMSRALENYQEARQTYSEVLPEAMQHIQNMSEEDYNKFVEANSQLIKDYELDPNDRTSLAKGIAKASADRTFQMDWANVAFDIIQMYALRNAWRGLKNDPTLSSKVRRANKDIAKYPGKSVDEIKAIKAARPFKEKAFEKAEDLFYGSKLIVGAQLSEGAEEAINYISQREGVNLGQILLGKEKGSKDTGWATSLSSLFDPRIAQYANAPELWDAAFWGVMGGIIFQAGGSKFRQIYNKLNKAKSDATDEAANKLPWYKFDELTETKRKLTEIEKRPIDFENYRRNLDRIKSGVDIYRSSEGNEVTFKSEVEQLLAEKKLRQEYIALGALRALNSGNFDLYKSYIQDENLRKGMVELGMFDNVDATTKERIHNPEQAERESKEFVQEALETIDNVERIYDEELDNLNAQATYINAGKNATIDGDFKSEGNIPVEYLQIIAVNNTTARLQRQNLELDFAEISAEVERQRNASKNVLDPNINYEASTKLGVLVAQLRYLRAHKKAIAKKENPTLSDSIATYNLNRQIEAIEKQILETGNTVQLSFATLESINSILNDEDKTVISETDEDIINQLTYKAFLTDENSSALPSNFDKHDILHINPLAKSRLTSAQIAEFETLAQDTKTSFDTLLQEAPAYNKALQDKAAIELQLATLDSQIAHTLNEVQHQISVLHNTMNEARATAINNANITLAKLYRKYGYAIQNMIDREVFKDEENWYDYRPTEMSDAEYKDFKDALDILQLAKPYNKGLLDDIEQIFEIEDAIKAQSEIETITEDDTETSSTSEEETGEIQLKNSEEISATQSAEVEDIPQLTSEADTSQAKPENQPFVDESIAPPTQEKPVLYVTFSLNTNNPRSTKVYKDKPRENSVALYDNGNGTYRVDVLGKEKYLQHPAFFSNTNNIDHLENVYISEDPIVKEEKGQYVIIQKGKLSNSQIDAESSISSTGEQDSNSQTIDNIAIDGTKVDSSTPVKEVKKSSTPAVSSSKSVEDVINQVPSDFNIKQQALKEFVDYTKTQNTNNEEIDLEKKTESLITNIVNQGVTRQDAENAVNWAKTIIQKRLDKQKDTTAANTMKSSITEVLYQQSSLTESLIQKNSFADGYKTAVEGMIEAYFKEVGMSKIDDKYYINLEDLLRYVNTTVKDNSMASFIYVSLKEYLKTNEAKTKFVTMDESEVDKSEFLDNVKKDIEDRVRERLDDESIHRVNIRAIENADEDSKKAFYDAFDNLNVGDELTLSINSNGPKRKVHILDKQNRYVGELSIPYINSKTGAYEVVNDGWNTDILTTNQGTIQSKLKELFNRWLTSDDTNCVELNNLILQWSYDLNEENHTKLLNEFANNDEVKKAKNNGFTNKDYSDAQLLDGLAKLWKFVRVSPTTNKELHNKFISISLDNWFNKLRNSYDAITAIKSNINVSCTVHTISDGELIRKENRVSNGDKLPVASEALAGGVNPDIHKIGIADRNNLGMLSTSGKGLIPFSGVGTANTFVVIPNRSGRDGYVQAYPCKLLDENIGKDAKAIKNAIVNRIKELFTSYGENQTEEGYEAIKDFLIKTFSSLNGNSSLFWGVSVKIQKSENNESISIGVPNSDIALSINKYSNFEGSAPKVGIKNKGVKGWTNVDYNTINKKEGALATRFNELFDNIRFMFSYAYIASDNVSDMSLAGICKRKNGKFIIEVGDKTWTYNSYNEFILKNDLVRLNTEPSKDGTNYRRRSESNQRANQVFKIQLLIDGQQTTSTPVEESNKSQQSPIISQTIGIPAQVTQILESTNDDLHKGLAIAKTVYDDIKVLKAFETLELLPKSIIFDAEFNNREGYAEINGEYNRTTGTITVGTKWKSLFDNLDTREQAIRKLIHEQLHYKLTKKRGFVRSAEAIYNEFKEALESGLTNNTQVDIFAKETSKTREEVLTYFKSYLFEDIINNAPENATPEQLEALKLKTIEEFFVESLTSNELATLLNSIDAKEPGDIKKRKNLFQKILEFLSNVFGWNVRKGSLYEKELVVLRDIRETKKGNKTETNDKQPKAPSNQNQNEKIGETSVKPEKEQTQEKTDNSFNDISTDLMDLYESSITEVISSNSYTKEMNQIKSEAIVNSTFMKAPNGNPTNLTERQWLQVRTKAFKNWFGDWEKGFTVQQDDNSFYRGQFDEPYIDKNDNLILYGRKDSLYEKAGYKDKGVSVTRDLKSAIEYGEGQLEIRINLVMDNSMDESEQIAVIDNGYYLIQFKDSIPNKEIKEANESKIVGNITIPKGSYIIEHYIQGELVETIGTINNSNVSKVVDENGEPLVVYHGTNVENITIFDRNKGKEHGTFTATNRLGSFFTDITPEAESYAAVTWLRNSKEGKPTIYDCFVDIKNPLYFDNISELRTYMMSDFEYNEEGDPISKVIINEKYDGIVVKQVNKSNLAKEIIPRTANQIKSATDNVGNFSTTDDNIYHSSITELARKVPSVSSYTERLPLSQQANFLSLVHSAEVSSSCR